MTISRRDLLRAGAVAAAGAAAGVDLAAAPARLPQAYFGVHPFIEANPKAVFIRRTHVPHKMAEDAKRKEGLTLAREIFVPMDRPGVPVSHRIVLKPNVCSVHDRRRPDVENWGTGTDPQFYEGMVMGLQELGLKKFHFVEANNFHEWNLRGFVDINERLGVQMNECERRVRNFKEGYEMTWTKVPEAVVYSRIPHYAPVNEPDTWLLNIAKWKAHGMCLTQSVKNEQGLVVLPYVRFCPGWKMVTGVPDFMKPDIHPRVETVVNKFFERHVKMGYSRYDSPAQLSPMHQEIWAHKTLDNMSVLKTGLAMIDGIYGRDGNGFGIGNDYLTNLVMFSKDKFRLDLIGLYLGGHEPGNVHLYRIAKERGLSDTFNPWEVPIYEWVDGQAVPRKLTDFPRTPLKTYYLQRRGEPEYHLVNEPFDYDKHKA
ncbi:MAG TPA: DUF362 domain-containing protein [Bryobacteraceae bacterium]|nr:DUF362 domain-containing protein [Bryobacteraceae bacterium]